MNVPLKSAGLMLLTVLGSASLAPPAFALPPTPASRPAAAAVDHSTLDKLLKKHVTSQGLVNYKGFKADQQEFNRYLDQLSQNPPAAAWSKAEQMSYWINAYNAFTIRLILDHYPLQSIKDIGSNGKTAPATTPWAAKFFTIGGKKMSLDEIEHGTLRKQFNDPRIHFALVCAAVSCPRLRNEAYSAARLDAQLDDQARDFVNNPAKNKVGKGSAQLSRYFDWYKGDWNANGQSVGKWVNKYSKTKLGANAPITFLDYNWQLNEQ
ncbi:DUF547 domain-containing protein [Hymenobacter algoricola]|uniref:DUF547 domain-containing protein n=1 Tax=Hymenobacter algoricola TaxID=486267 RepID=A0ABP7MPD6_9BACT